MAGRLRRTVTAVTLVALLLPMAAATSLADTGPAPTESFKISDNGYSASAGEGGCDDEGDIETCTFTSIFVFSGNRREQGSGTIHGTEVCYDTGTDVFNLLTGEVLSSIQESGCSFDPGEGTVIERDLSAATIAPTTITLETFVPVRSNAARPEIRATSRSKAPSRRPRLRRARQSATSSTTASAPTDLAPAAHREKRCSPAPSMENRWSSALRSTKAQAASARSARLKPDAEEYATGPRPCRDEGR